MASVNEILTRLNLNRRDLSNVSLSQLETVFKDLTVKEISTLCAVNRRFNTLCKDESFWRNKVFDDYGIKKKYGSTWRQTAITMDKVNMINLGTKWIDGRTYREILDDALKNGADTVLEAQIQYLLPYVDGIDNATNLQFDFHDEKEIQDFVADELGKHYTYDELIDILLIKSSEIDVIYTTVLTYKGEHNLYLPGHTITDVTTGTALQSYSFLRDMIDPVIYVMQFSSFSNDKLDTVYIG
uniref:F-box-like protein n=1 Tax=Pithovirus LCPAC406 TaxID=2506599 RepID=A0A481ZF91_9VIRU|nr:MAG: F-box-like protein [Pithovirus LCPAC406]